LGRPIRRTGRASAALATLERFARRPTPLGLGGTIPAAIRPEDPGRPIDVRVLPVEIAHGRSMPPRLVQQVEVDVLTGEDRPASGDPEFDRPGPKSLPQPLNRSPVEIN